MNRYRLYSDFYCPFCYAMHERLHALGVMGRISWQGVQHASHLPVPMPTWSRHLAAELKQEVEAVRRLASELPITVPSGKPNTRRAIAAAARALFIDSARGIVGGLSGWFARDLNLQHSTISVIRENAADGACAYQILGGLRANVSDHVFLVMGYKYFVANYQWESELANGGHGPSVTLNYRTHIISGSLGFRF